MTDINKAYRIRTNVGSTNTSDYVSVNADLVQDYDTFEVLSVKIKSKDTYMLHNSNYGVIVGRVIANNGFGIPNAKLSIFIPLDPNNGEDINNIYPFNSSVSKDKNGVRYNLLPNERVDGCHQVVGSFPTKRYMLDNDVILEVFDDYYTFTTKTNNSGDYMICGVPVGTYTLHMDLDLSDCGILSQKPRDFVYKGYTIEQFESPTKFKGGTDYNNLSQIFTQDQIVNVNPFWGNDSLGETIGITRADINVNFKFEPTCVFIGSIVSDNSSNGFSKKCIPTENMGNMEELVTGEGKIEMIRKTPGGSVEQFQVKGDKLINADGIWCYQIPMNLDYMVTDEYGNMVPTDDPERGIPTRTSVRFRISMEDSEENTDNFFRGKVLVPHNPQIISVTDENGSYRVNHEEYDYEFGTYTRDESFRDLFWNNVYSVKSYIPRIQKSNGWKRKPRFSGIKGIQNYGPNNPMPYNNIRIRLPLMFTIMCALIKAYIFIVSIINTVTVWIFRILAWVVDSLVGTWSLPFVKKFCGKIATAICNLRLIVLKDGLCPDLENWYFAPSNNKSENSNPYEFSGYTSVDRVQDGFFLAYFGGEDNDGENDENETYTSVGFRNGMTLSSNSSFTSPINDNHTHPSKLYWKINIMERTLGSIAAEEFEQDDKASIDAENNEEMGGESACITKKTDYLIACLEMNLAQEYKVINFDFYNDWINGVIYNPRWVRFKKKKVRFLWITWAKEKIKGCMDDTTVFSRNRKYVQQCSIGYKEKKVGNYRLLTNVENPIEYDTNENPPKVKKSSIVKSNNFHKRRGIKMSRVFGEHGGICHEGKTLKGQSVYYLKPCEFTTQGKKINLYATDIILLGTFNDCDLNGIPQTFQHLNSTTYIMPTNLALTNMDTNGPLYAQDNGTVCMGEQDTKEQLTKKRDELISGCYFAPNGMPYPHPNSNPIVRNCINEVLTWYNNSLLQLNNIKVSGASISEVKQTLGNELMYYEFTNNNDNKISDNTFFGGEDTYNDTIAITESAGISWNYTGPGQGEIDEERMYYPGGHFLGLSCVNSQTNIKSCINLSRICEIGANMSQRKENVRKIDDNGKLRYTYTVPNGFISGDDIVDTDFRSMFATLNQKRLRATKRDKSTGYLVYDFEFEYPTNFDGSFGNIVYDITYNDRTPYNSNISGVTDENLKSFGIARGFDNEDYDDEETENTQTRTREMTSVDYYAFRFGLTHKELKYSLNSKFRFLEKEWGAYYLPQYENSYYFYFGLRQGATALDEFNKQFYAECDDLKIKKAPNLIVVADISNFCDGKGKIRVMTEGLSLPYQYIEVYCHNTNETYKIGTRPQYGAEMAVLMEEMFYLPKENEVEHEFEFGKYTITVVDDDDISISKDVEIGTNLFHYNYSIVNFTKPIDENGNGDFKIFNGGFALIEGFYCEYENENAEYVFQLKDDESDSYIGRYEYIEYPNDDIYWHLAYGVKKDKDYSLYLRYRCDENSDYVDIRITTVRFRDNSYLELMIGEDGLYTESPLMDSTIMNRNMVSWWFDRNNYDVGADNHADNYKRWFYRKMFSKQSNHGEFDSRVFVHGGRKALWGVPQTRNAMVNINGWRRIYCSEREYELPNGTYLNDRKTLKPTYGVDMCGIASSEEGSETLRSGNVNEGNCTFNYCAQAYNNSDVCGKYGFKYDKNHHYGQTIQIVPSGDRFFHEGYGCVFKPLPFGNLVFLEYNDMDELIEKIENATTAKFGIVYPTFIYPVMKRPFFADFKAVLWNNINVSTSQNEFGDLSYVEKDKDYGFKLKFNIYNGVTYDKEFEYIKMMGYNFDREVDHGDTYGLEEASNEDRIKLCERYNDNCLSDMEDYNHIVSAIVKEGVPSEHHDDLTDFSTYLSVNEQYSFIDNILYRKNIETNKIDYVAAIDEEDTKYYIGHYSPKIDGVDFLESRNRGFDGKYAYYKNGNEYIVLCTFGESMGINSNLWYTNVFVNVRDIDDGECFISYDYVDEDGVNKTFDKFVTFNGDYSSHPYAINDMLDLIYNRGYFNTDNGVIVFPFKPILNYKVKNTLKINNTEYDDFGMFMQRLVQRRLLMPIDHLENLKPLEADSVVFGVGVKTIPNTEDNEIVSNVYKVYPSAIRSFYNTNSSLNGYNLTVTPDPYSSSGTTSGSGSDTGESPYSVGKGSHNVNMTVEAESPCIIKFDMENNGGWCYYEVNGEGINEYGSKSVVYNGIPINVVIHFTENNENGNRSCTLGIKSYFGVVRDSVTVNLSQKGLNSSPTLRINVSENFCGQNCMDGLIRDNQQYSYTFKVSCSNFPTLSNYEKLYLIVDGNGGYTNNHTYVHAFEGSSHRNPYLVPYRIEFDGHDEIYQLTTSPNSVNPFISDFEHYEIEVPDNSLLGDYIIEINHTFSWYYD